MQNKTNSWILNTRWLVLGVTLAVFAGVAGTLFVIRDIDAFERHGLIDEATIAAASITASDLYSLSGSEADVNNTVYLSVKDRLMRISKGDSNIRFAYILGDSGTNKLFFYGDSEPINSPDYSAPGDIYEQTTEAEIASIRSGTSFIEGPSSDQWGTWVSAFAPIIDKATGKTVGILGLDVGVHEWNIILLKYGFLPVLITLLFILLIIIYAFFGRSLQRLALDLDRSREKILLEELKLKTICDNLPVGVLVLRTDTGAIEIMNNAVVKIFGRALMPKTETLDKDLQAYEIIHEDGTPYLFEELPTAMVMKTGEVCMKQDIFVRHPDGVIINTRGTSAPVKDSSGNIQFVVTVIEDVTLEREVDKMKTEFVSLASHQLRTPLTGVRWALERLFEGKIGVLNEKQTEYLTQVRDSNDRLERLVENLLNVSHIETGDRFEIKKTSVDITAMIDSLASDLVGLAKEHDVEVVKGKGFTEKRILSVDDEKMRQVLQNLLSNAIKYSHPGGIVRIDYQENNGKGIISVKDTGLGIPKTQQTHVFEKFFRGDNVHTVETQGTGLGLYIAREILKKMGGDLRFESKENIGTTFYASVPIF